MNGIDDLRSTLDEHASHVVDRASVERRTAVHQRVGVVRRRRRVVAASGVAAVVAVVGGIALLPGASSPEPAPADSEVVGIDVPREIDSLGFTYRLSDTLDGRDGEAVLDLAASDLPRLVTWGTSGADNLVRLKSPGLMTPRDVDVSDFDSWTYVAPGDRGQVAVTVASGEPGIAVYVLDDGPRPAGTTVDGVTFRQDASGGQLIGSVVGRPGEAEVQVLATPEGGRLQLAYYCSGGPRNAWIHLNLRDDEEIVWGRSCGDRVPVDASLNGTDTVGVEPGVDVDLRFYVTDGPRGPVLDDADLRIGLGVYNPVPLRAIGDGLNLPEQLEAQGRLWVLDRVERADMTADGATFAVPAVDAPALVYPRWARTGEAAVGVTIDGQPVTNAMSVGGGGIPGLLVSAADESLSVEAQRGQMPDDAAAALGIYVPAD